MAITPMYDLKRDLKNSLSQELLGHPYDRSSMHEETFLIDHLSEVFDDWCVGEVSYDEFMREFKGRDLKGFDIDLWLADYPDDFILPET